jgi:calmodulin
MSELDREEISSYFKNYDNNHDGVLDFSEFSELISGLGLNVSEDKMKDGFNKVDTGNNNVINFDEFMAWWGDHD